jgi:ribosome-binding protein aMBF1 (putative translation factor)
MQVDVSQVRLELGAITLSASMRRTSSVATALLTYKIWPMGYGAKALQKRSLGVTLQQTFGAKIVGLREKYGMSQEVLSQRTGIGVTHISRLENGHKEPCLKNLAKIGRAFDISLSELLQDVKGR